MEQYRICILMSVVDNIRHEFAPKYYRNKATYRDAQVGLKVIRLLFKGYEVSLVVDSIP
jgi:hypothetical protein